MLSRIPQNKRLWVVLLVFAANGVLLYKYSQLSSDDEASVADPVNGRSYRALRPEDSTSHRRGTYVPPLVLYNRVPKTGSTTLANIAYKLTSPNHFHMLHINVTYKNSHYLNIIDQERFVRNVSEWSEKQPAIYHGHLRFIDFTRFGYKNPIYINILRDPLERLISYYYFLRYGDDYRPHLVRASSKDTSTLDDCLILHGKDCDLTKVMWLQVPFFCGQSVHCQTPSNWALDQAKRNLANHYLLVGVTEQLGDFIAVLEAILPDFFRGAYELYKHGGLGHLRKTKGKRQPSDESLEIIRNSQIYQLEYEFYLFAKEQFNFLRQRTLIAKEDGTVAVNRPGFKYEKIFPQE